MENWVSGPGKRKRRLMEDVVEGWLPDKSRGAKHW